MMKNVYDAGSLVVLVAGLLILVCISQPVLAAEDAYLKALEAEAANLHKADTQQDQVPNNSSEKDSEVNKSAQTQSDIRKTDFEADLKKQLPNTYTIYSRLAPEQKMMVVELYFSNDKKMALASKQIFDFYLFDRKK